MVGILVHGDNHFIVRGPLPDHDTALALRRARSVIKIGTATPSSLDRWEIVTQKVTKNPKMDWACVKKKESQPCRTILGQLRGARN